MKYKPNMSPEDQAKMLEECNALDRAYQDAAAIDEANSKASPPATAEDEELESECEWLTKAGLDRRGRP